MKHDVDSNIDTGTGVGTDTDTTTTAKNIAQSAVGSIISHYSQDIHLPSDITADSIVDGDNNIPYFDALLGKPNQGSKPIIEHWLQALLNDDGNINNNNNNNNNNNSLCPHIQTKTDLIETYYLLVRPACFYVLRKKISGSEDGLTGISSIHVKDTTPLILIYYEMMIQGFISFTSQTSKIVTDSALERQSPLSESVKGDKVDEGGTILRTCIDVVYEVIQCLFHDIQSLTCIERIKFVENKHDEKSSNSSTTSRRRVKAIQNLILPTLLRIMQHTIHIMHEILQLLPSTLPSKSFDTNKSIPIPEIEKIQSSLLIGAIVASSFCSDCGDRIVAASGQRNTLNGITSELNILEILPKKWKEKFTMRHLLKTCAYSPNHLSSSACAMNADSNIMNEGEDINNINGNDGINEYFWNLLRHSGLKKEENESITACFDQDMLNIDDSLSSTLKMTWLDKIQGVGFRSGRSLLQSIYILSTSLQEHVQREKNAQKQSIDEPYTAGTTMLDSIVRVIGPEKVVNLVRANFFGRLNHSSKDQSICDKEQSLDDAFIEKMNGHTNTLAFNAIAIPSVKNKDMEKNIHDISAIRRLAKLKPLGGDGQHKRKPLYVEENDLVTSSREDKPFNQIKARITSSIRLLSSLSFPSVSTKVWMDSLPIIYTLIDSCDSSHQSLGGALFLHLLGECTVTSFLSVGNFSEERRATDDVNYATYFEGAAQVVSSAIRTCDDAVAISVLSEVRSKLFEIAGKSAIPRISTLRRIAATETMTWVKQRSYCGPNGEENIVSAITASLISAHSLLVQLSKEPNAAAMEIGRLGLCTFLPLIRWDAASLVGRRIQYTAISCLVSLMMGAYPVMERHGGKIMAELLSCIDRGLRDLEIQDRITLTIHAGTKSLEPIENSALKILIAFAAHAASVSSILCGIRASESLHQIENGDYSQDLKGWREIIKRQSWKMLEKEEKCHTSI